jgi:predicted DNA-binding transcriptional regulator YafY
VLLEALWSGRRLKFLYEKAGGEASEREVDPLGLVARANRWYLVAAKGDERRTYRVSRISSPQIMPERASRPEAFDLAAYWEMSTNRFREHLPRYDATFLVTEHILPWVCYRPWRVLEQAPAGEHRYRVSLRFDAPEEARQFALGHGAELEVVEPQELREHVIATAQAVLAAYAGEAPIRAPLAAVNCSLAAPAPSMPGAGPRGP